MATTFFTNELAFEVPDGAVDRTQHEIHAPLPDDGFLTLVIKRKPLPEGVTLEDAVGAHLAEDARRFQLHQVLERRERVVSGQRALEIASSWAYGRRRVYTREVHLVAPRPGVRLTFAAAAPLEHRAACDAYFDRAMSTLELSREEPR
jgi:hypothetical protein